MALEHAAKTNNKHTCQILAAVVKYIWILLREAEHMHNYANMLIGFQQPSYSRWICTSRVLPVTHRATRSGLCVFAAAASTAADAPPCGLLRHCQDGGNRPGRNQQRRQTRYGAQHSYGDVCECHWSGHLWDGAGQLSVLDSSRFSVYRAEMFGTGLRQQLNTKTAMCDCEI